MRAWSYTVNSPSRARQLVADGLDGLITDDPAGMREIISAA